MENSLYWYKGSLHILSNTYSTALTTKQVARKVLFPHCLIESKRSLKSRSDEHKRSVRNCDCDKNEIAEHCWEADHNFNWDQKKVIDRESRLIPRKIKKPYIL